MELICFHRIAASGLEAIESTKSYGGKVRPRLKDYTITKQGPKIRVAAATAASVGAGALWWLGLDLAS
jgi:hypothetical protein